jgi:hypothetical protein
MPAAMACVSTSRKTRRIAGPAAMPARVGKCAAAAFAAGVVAARRVARRAKGAATGCAAPVETATKRATAVRSGRSATESVAAPVVRQGSVTGMGIVVSPVRFAAARVAVMVSAIASVAAVPVVRSAPITVFVARVESATAAEPAVAAARFAMARVAPVVVTIRGIAVPQRPVLSVTASVAPSSMAIRSAVQMATARRFSSVRSYRSPARRRAPETFEPFIPISMHAEGSSHG